MDVTLLAVVVMLDDHMTGRSDVVMRSQENRSLLNNFCRNLLQGGTQQCTQHC